MVRFSAEKKYANILVVDDSVSSGKTMQNVLRFVRKEFPAATVKCFVLYAPPASSGGAAASWRSCLPPGPRAAALALGLRDGLGLGLRLLLD